MAKKCVVLGNGPSLNKSLLNHPDFFKDKELICVNNFASSELYISLKPENYVIMDPSFWKTEGMSSELENILKLVKSKTSWPLRFFIPEQSRKSGFFQKLQKENPNIEVIFFNYTVFTGFQKISHFIYRNNLGMPQSQNVVVAGLFIAVNMNFSEIYLVGADHNWHESLMVDNANIVCLKHIHFYDNESEVQYRKFYKSTANKDTFTMREIFQTWAKVFYGYEVVRKYADSLNIKIFNASEISFIDALDRKNI